MTHQAEGEATHKAAVALGSNLGDREVTLREAITHVADLGTVQAVSPFYDTAPIGYLEQPRFLNAALLLETSLAPLPLLDGLLAIEQALGRDRNQAIPKGPRALDLDLLLYDDLIITVPELILPHPAMTERRFVLQPLADIAPGLRHPTTGLTIAGLLAQLP